MKNFQRRAVLVAVVLSAVLAQSPAVAQHPTRTAVRPTRGAPIVALIDVSRIFKSHSRFKAMMDGMKADVARAETQVKSERDAIRKRAEEASSYRKGTPDYKAIEEEVTKRQADLSVRVQLQKKEFLEREAKIYHNVYQEILQEVDYYCASNGITMVLRFNGEQVDANRPEDVLRNINKPVVWHNRNLDITQVVIDNLNRRTSTVPHATRPGVGAYNPHR